MNHNNESNKAITKAHPISKVCIYNSLRDKGGRGSFCYLINDYIAKKECSNCPAFNMHLFNHAHLDSLHERVRSIEEKGGEA